ncbi:imidazolonepropionase [Vibrio sp. S4M6]|uniref:imidazolonepropionase n=1 Tax=Vibrio sinus TaxID=2946865 RepID=UPI00202AAA90|nr:imidazolonepropionase [Vibrio sinus]MCL9783771.1 imidazolonepropionase [Vibrio sinus]
MCSEHDLILVNARLVSMESDDRGYAITSPKTVTIQKGKIHSITDTNSTEHSGVQVVDCKNKLVTPGLIDSHTHLVFGGNRAEEFEQRLKGVSYEAIAKQGGGILSTVNATRKATEDQLVENTLPILDGLLRSGVTSVEIKSGYGLTLEDELKMLRAAKSLENHRRIKVSTTLLAAHTTPTEYKHNPDAYVDLICQEIIPAASELELADSVDVFCESIGFNIEQTERVFATAQQYGLKIKGHVEQLSNLGGAQLVAKYKGLSADHIEYLDAVGVQSLADSGSVAMLLPGAFYFLKETQLPPISQLRELNVPMAIATDFNPGTSPFADLTMMMNMGCTLFGLTPEEALRGVTCHAAKALGLGHSRGQIKQGYEADLAIWNIAHPAELSYQVGIPRLSARIVNGELCHD